MAGLAALGAIAKGVGTVVSVVGTIASGRRMAAAQSREAEVAATQREYEAAQYDIAAKEERAAAQRDAFRIDHDRKLALSRVQALSAASGLGPTDASVLDIAADIEREGSYREALANYGGEARAANLRDTAKGLRYDAAEARRSGKITASSTRFNTGVTALSTLISGTSSMYEKYGAGFAGAGKSSAQQYRYG